MPRPVTLFTGQWADLKLEEICEKAKAFGYDGVELACWGDHVDVPRAAADKAYAKSRKEIPAKYGLKVFAISNHLAGQAVCDQIDERHKAILPERIWGDGKPEGVRQRAAEEMKLAAQRRQEHRRGRGQRLHRFLDLASALQLPAGQSPEMIDARLQGFRQALEPDPGRVQEAAASSSRWKSIPRRSPSTPPAPSARLKAIGQPQELRLQLRPQPPGLSERRLRELHPQVRASASSTCT